MAGGGGRGQGETERAPILILTSSMGAGHDGVSYELARRLEARGHRVHVMDMVKVLPFGFGRAMRLFYSLIIRWVPWIYERIYRVWLEPSEGDRATMSPVTVLLERRILHWVRENRPGAIVTTFHVCTQALGAMRSEGRLDTPVVNVIVDFAVHALWVHPGVDVNVCLHESCAAEARLHLGAAEGDERVEAPGPVVRRAFLDGVPERDEARLVLGVRGDGASVLVVGGSWGSGDLVATVRSLLDAGRFVPLVVCGRNRRLQRRIEGLCARAGRGRVFGWVDDMAEVMAAADALVENAGGLTAMEAAGAGVPIVSFRPIPGHGRANVEAMSEAGVASCACTPAELVALLRRLTVSGDERARQVALAASMFRGDAADVIARVAESGSSGRV